MVPDYMKIVIIHSCLRFSNGDTLAQRLISPEALQRIYLELSNEKNVSGISVVIFTVKPGNMCKMYRTAVGQMLPVMKRCCIVQRVLYYRRELRYLGLMSQEGTIIE